MKSKEKIEKQWLEEGTKNFFEREKCWVWFGEEERVNVKKKEKRKKERKKLNLIKEERETN